MSFAENKDFNEVRDIQKRILDAYEQDFSKHAPYEIVPKIRMVWNSIPSQLAKENKKFIYGLVREGGRAKDYETAILYADELLRLVCHRKPYRARAAVEVEQELYFFVYGVFGSLFI